MVNYKCLVCSTLISNCELCTSPTVCIKCVNNTFLDINAINYKICLNDCSQSELSIKYIFI